MRAVPEVINVLSDPKNNILDHFSASHFCSEISLSSFSHFVSMDSSIYYLNVLPSILGSRIRAQTKLDWGTEEKSASSGKSGN